ncbi:TcaA NTF2-like domain-containing protein [Streptococcus cameli]
MEKQEKWIQLFETVTGRKPSPQEFMAGKACDFDLKQIKSIASGPSQQDQVVEQSSVAEPVLKQPVESQSVTPQTIPSVQTAGVTSAVPPTGVSSALAPQPMKQPWSKEKKKKVFIGGAIAAVIALLGAGYYYLDQQTGSDVAAEKFLKAVVKEDYSSIAKNFSSQDEKWKQADAKAFISYLDKEINIQTELEKMIADPSYVYVDDKGNRLIGMKKTDDILGLFSNYKVVTYPVEISAKTNVDSLVLGDTKLPKDKEVVVGKTSLPSKKFHLSGKNELGEISTEIVANKQTAENNEIYLSLNSIEKNVVAKLPDGLPTFSDTKLMVNDKEIATSLSKQVKVLENQTLEIFVKFSYEGTPLNTEKAEVVVSPAKDSIEVELTLSNDTLDKIKAAQKVKEEKEAAAQKEKAQEAAIKSFMMDYISAMRSSIRVRQNHFSRYYDTSSAAYRTMDNYVTGGGVAKNRIDYQETLDYTVTDIRKVGEDYAVTVHNKFREVYLSGKSDIVEKNQVFKLRPNGDSFLIYEISEY